MTYTCHWSPNGRQNQNDAVSMCAEADHKSWLHQGILLSFTAKAEFLDDVTPSSSGACWTTQPTVKSPSVECENVKARYSNERQPCIVLYICIKENGEIVPGFTVSQLLPKKVMISARSQNPRLRQQTATSKQNF